MKFATLQDLLVWTNTQFADFCEDDLRKFESDLSAAPEVDPDQIQALVEDARERLRTAAARRLDELRELWGTRH
jgi:hypothetical protein